eukprot:7391311-Prymnesium_polylepis.1
MTRVLIQHKDTTMQQYGAHLFAAEDESTQKKRMKTIINGFDMGSAETAWEKKFGNPYNRSIRDVTAKVHTLGGTFSLVEYRKEQRLLASLLAQRAPAAVDFIKHATSDQATPDHKAHMTWQSYVLQEAEAIARYHKID